MKLGLDQTERVRETCRGTGSLLGQTWEIGHRTDMDNITVGTDQQTVQTGLDVWWMGGWDRWMGQIVPIYGQQQIRCYLNSIISEGNEQR